MNLHNIDPGWFFLIIFLLFATPDRARWRRWRADWILLPQNRFWEIVAREGKPLVLITMLGFLRKRICYLYPYQGVIFYTWTRPTELPPGTALIPKDGDFV